MMTFLASMRAILSWTVALGMSRERAIAFVVFLESSISSPSMARSFSSIMSVIMTGFVYQYCPKTG